MTDPFRRHLNSLDIDLLFWPLAAAVMSIIAAVAVLFAVAT